MAKAYLSLGSNLGARLDNLETAIEKIRKDPKIEIVAESQIYETSPVEYRDQPDFFNLILEIETKHKPIALLDRCLGIESEMGRQRTVDQGPRNIDIDILLYDKKTIDEPRLQIPHPRLTKRAFVLVPLTDLRPQLSLPSGEALIDFIPSTSSQQVKKLEPGASD